ncbi:DUF4265 domain-containing protein [Actinomadura rupiterrae]|uniref:DUF4265 domain-containing protein n=1 Tax=Actinomadura rupiterrae TaxID=559627 RepID=UPI0020A587AE|nr:DUF4265 domain-containing protein [Actinomadura rupiterrae]MCP2337363.1 hypothetical protein [Actinomadura rupiterrae]
MTEGLDHREALPQALTGRKLFKIAFDLEQERPDWPPVAVERLWGEKTGIRLEVRVVNVPFFARGLAIGDLVQVRPDHDRRELVFDHHKAKSDHSTIRIVEMEDGCWRNFVADIEALGCHWEVGDVKAMVAIDVPGDVNYATVIDLLLRHKLEGRIGVQEAAISKIHAEQLQN